MITRCLIILICAAQWMVAQAPQLPAPPPGAPLPRYELRPQPIVPAIGMESPSPCQIQYRGKGEPVYLRIFLAAPYSPGPPSDAGKLGPTASTVIWRIFSPALLPIASGTLKYEDAIAFNGDLSWKINVGVLPPGPQLFAASTELYGQRTFCTQALQASAPPSLGGIYPGNCQDRIAGSPNPNCEISGHGQGAPPIIYTAGGGAPPEFQTVRIFFATDRARGLRVKEAQAFTGDRSADGTLSFGAAEISIPRDHRLGELERKSIWSMDYRDDPAKFVTLLRSNLLPEGSFITEVQNKLGSDPNKEALIFVHGYNVTFDDAAMRLGQITYDLGFAGAPILYSWPSKGATLKYTADEASVEWTTGHFERFLRTVAQQSGAQTIFIVAHSMGNRAVSGALRSIADKGQTLKPQLKEIVMAAPDIDAGVFQQLAATIAQTGGHFTIYESSKDLALQLSHRFHSYPRLGDTKPAAHAYEGYDCIDATAVDTGFLGHSYFAESTSVLADIFDLIRGKGLSDRFRLVKTQPNGQGCWMFRK